MQSRQHLPSHRGLDLGSVRGTKKFLSGLSWNLTFMQNQIEKGKVTMMKSRDVRTRSHSQTPKPEDLVPKTKQKKKGGGKNTYTGNVTIFTDQYLFIQFLVGGSEQCVDFARNLEGAGYQWSVHMMGHCLGRAL